MLLHLFTEPNFKDLKGQLLNFFPKKDINSLRLVSRDLKKIIDLYFQNQLQRLTIFFNPLYTDLYIYWYIQLLNAKTAQELLTIAEEPIKAKIILYTPMLFQKILKPLDQQIIRKTADEILEVTIVPKQKKQNCSIV